MNTKPASRLIVCDLVQEGRLEGGLLHRDGALAFRFATLWRVVADRRTKPDLRLPFYHLKGDGAWRPLDEGGRPAESRERAVIAQLDVSLLLCLRDPGRGIEPLLPLKMPTAFHLSAQGCRVSEATLGS